MPVHRARAVVADHIQNTMIDFLSTPARSSIASAASRFELVEDAIRAVFDLENRRTAPDRCSLPVASCLPVSDAGRSLQ
jgi:hypothetical protein